MMEELVLRRHMLCTGRFHLALKVIKADDFAVPKQAFNEADRVVFIDDDGRTKVFKDASQPLVYRKPPRRKEPYPPTNLKSTHTYTFGRGSWVFGTPAIIPATGEEIFIILHRGKLVDIMPLPPESKAFLKPKKQLGELRAKPNPQES